RRTSSESSSIALSCSTTWRSSHAMRSSTPSSRACSMCLRRLRAQLPDPPNHHTPVAVGTDRVTEVGTCPLIAVALDLRPVVRVVADLLAVRANRKKRRQLRDLCSETEDTLGDTQTHPELVHVERLVQEIIDTGVRRLALVFDTGRGARQEDEVDVLLRGAG